MKPRPKQPAKRRLQRLIAAAHASELEPWAALGKRHFVFKGDTAFLACGVGPVAAAFGLAHFLEDHRPEEIVAVGTAGVIATDKFGIGDVVAAAKISTATGFKERYAPKIQKRDIFLSTKPARLKTANVYCPQEITRDESWRERLAAAGHEVEHLEAFAFAFVARKFRIPLKIYLGLANNVGPRAHEEWIKNAPRIMRRIADVSPC